MTIQLYGKKYAPNDREAVNSLFKPGGTVNGLYKVTRRGVRFYALNGELRAFIRKDGLGPVSATRLDDGRTWYSFALSRDAAAWMQEPASYTERCDGARALAASVFSGKA
jgi:hypothetical protein